MLVLQTRPMGLRYPPPKGLGNRIAERQLAKLNPALVPLYHNRNRVYDATCNFILAEEAKGAEAEIPTLALRLPEGTPSVDRLETRREILHERASTSEEYTRSRLRQTL